MLTDEERKKRNAERSAKWREANSDRARAGVKAWVDANPEKKKAGDRAYREANAEKIAGQQKLRREADPEAYKVYWRDYHQKNKEKRREQNWMRKYNITRAQYDDMLAQQGGRCASCPRTEPGGRGAYFHVDHDHQTGKVRGLLCFGCNTALRDTAIMRGLLEYLVKPTTP